MAALELAKEVGEKYDLHTLHPGIYDVAGFGRVDLTTISLEQADALVAFGFPFLILKEAPDAKTAKTLPKQTVAVPDGAQDIKSP